MAAQEEVYERDALFKKLKAKPENKVWYLNLRGLRIQPIAGWIIQA